MSDEEILKEIELRIEAWFAEPGWSEENQGLRLVARTIQDLRENSESKDWNER